MSFVHEFLFKQQNRLLRRPLCLVLVTLGVVVFASAALAQERSKYSPQGGIAPPPERVVYYEKPEEFSVSDSIGQLGIALILGTLCFVFSYVLLYIEVGRRIGDKLSTEVFDTLCRATAGALGGGGFLIGLYSYKVFLVYFSILLAALIVLFLAGLVGKKYVDIKKDVDKQLVDHGHDMIDLKVRYRDEVVPHDHEDMREFRERIETQQQNPRTPQIGNNGYDDISARDVR